MKKLWTNLILRLAGPSMSERIPRELRLAENELLDAQFNLITARANIKRANAELAEAQAALESAEQTASLLQSAQTCLHNFKGEPA